MGWITTNQTYLTKGKVYALRNGFGNVVCGTQIENLNPFN